MERATCIALFRQAALVAFLNGVLLDRSPPAQRISPPVAYPIVSENRAVRQRRFQMENKKQRSEAGHGRQPGKPQSRLWSFDRRTSPGAAGVGEVGSPAGVLAPSWVFRWWCVVGS